MCLPFFFTFWLRSIGIEDAFALWHSRVSAEWSCNKQEQPKRHPSLCVCLKRGRSFSMPKKNRTEQSRAELAWLAGSEQAVWTLFASNLGIGSHNRLWRWGLPLDHSSFAIAWTEQQLGEVGAQDGAMHGCCTMTNRWTKHWREVRPSSMTPGWPVLTWANHHNCNRGKFTPKELHGWSLSLCFFSLRPKEGLNLWQKAAKKMVRLVGRPL